MWWLPGAGALAGGLYQGYRARKAARGDAAFQQYMADLDYQRQVDFARHG